MHTRTLTGRTALVRSDNGMRAAGHRAGYEYAHFPSRVTETVTAAIMPAFTFLIAVPIGGEAIAGHGHWDSGAWDMIAF